MVHVKQCADNVLKIISVAEGTGGVIVYYPRQLHFFKTKQKSVELMQLVKRGCGIFSVIQIHI